MKDFVRHVKSDAKRRAIIDEIDKETLNIPRFKTVLQNIEYKHAKDQTTLQVLITHFRDDRADDAE